MAYILLLLVATANPALFNFLNFFFLFSSFFLISLFIFCSFSLFSLVSKPYTWSTCYDVREQSLTKGLDRSQSIGFAQLNFQQQQQQQQPSPGKKF